MKLEIGGESGSPGTGFAKPNVFSGFPIISRNRNDLASSKSCQRLRPFAGSCRFCQRDGTRNDTRRKRAGAMIAAAIASCVELASVCRVF
jgi:hypothetical protein